MKYEPFDFSRERNHSESKQDALDTKTWLTWFMPESNSHGQTGLLERARELLSDTQCYLGVKEIGYQIGITNKGQFTREFRKLTGFTPTEFREMYAAMEQSNSQTAHE